MKSRISHQHMDGQLKQLEDDYVTSIKKTESENVEEFIETFFNDSWDYNEQNMDKIKTVFSRYEKGDISKEEFSGAFNEMIDCLHIKLKNLDKNKEYPLLHSKHGASLIISLVDGLVVQFYLGVYDIERLKEMTPHLKNVLLQTLKSESDVD